MSDGFGDLSVLRVARGLATELTTTPSFTPAEALIGEDLHVISDKQPPPRFGRMFPDLEEFRPERDSLVRLGQAMHAQTPLDDNVSLPAGYTYLGQFIDHDITFEIVGAPPVDNLPIEQIKQKRTPSLDLDSIYGARPADEEPGRPRRYQPDGIRLRVGETKGDSVLHVTAKFENDLPRKGNPIKWSTAAIEDPRNDENLAVAQTTVAFLKFHNKVVNILQSDYSGEQLFEESRRKVVKHYQWIVLHDFLPALIQQDVLNTVIDEGCKHFNPPAGEEPFMPLEFSRAAFRIGHSQVRDEYEWNRFFQSPSHGGQFRPTLSFLLDLTGFRDREILGHSRLPTTWIIDWTRFFNFADFPDVPPNPLLNFTKKIDTSIAGKFTNLPLPPFYPSETRSLAVLDLLRGREVGLPAAQTIAKRLKERSSDPAKIRVLTADEIAEKHPDAVRQHGFEQLTPLWYYVLREAEVLWQGNRMGPIGSYIVAETFVGLIKASKTSILREDNPGAGLWKPNLGKVPGRFNMADLLYFVGNLNPLSTL